MRQFILTGSGRSGLGILASTLVGLSLVGCSADVIRLDSPASFSLNDKSTPMTRPQAAMTRSSAGAGSVDPEASVGYVPPRGNANDQVKMAALPEPVSSGGAAGLAPSPRASTPPVKAKAAAPVAAVPGEKGEAIQVAPGDTLFGLSKRHHTSIAELMSVNGLASPNLKPGQTLYLPVGKSAGKKPLTRQPEAAVAAAAPAPAAQTPPSAAVLAKYDGTYTVKKGDSLYALAIQMKVPMAELQQVNAITDVRKVRPGAVLKVPTAALAHLAPPAPSVAAASAEPAGKVPAAVVAKDTAVGATAVKQPVLLNGDKKVAAVETPKTDATPAATPVTATAPLVDAAAFQPGKGTQVAAAGDAAAMGKLRWPAKGKVIGSFGPRPDGTHNDGVNLSVPLGTEVHAAEGGVVAYAGSELKGYGNLILVRHDNGWITAYAHNEEMLAKRGDKVKRGQVIGKAGKSGQVDQPQVHFELRQGSKPVDPTPFMEKL
jgi:murein DD-endopeptidase MepM/ murein hydrolase activator NlpD